MWTHSLRLVMSISSSRSSSKLARLEGSGATFLITASCSLRCCSLSSKALDDVCAFGASLCGVIHSAILHQVCWLSSLSAISTFNHSSARCHCFLCSVCCFPQLGSLRIANSQALNSGPGRFLHSCLDNSYRVATGRGTSCSFFRCSMCSPCSLCNRSFGDSSSHALVNPCGC